MRVRLMFIVMMLVLRGGDTRAAEPAETGPVEIATATTQMAFQGFLENGGVPVNGVVSIVAGLYSVPSGGSPLWTETHASVTVTDGVFTIALGSVTALNPSHFTGAPIYLGVAVNGGAELPRTRLLASPFALHAANADHALTADSALDGVWSAAGGDIYRLTGNIGIGTSAPAEKLHVSSGDIRVSSASDLGPTINSGIINMQNLAGTAGLMLDQNEIQTFGDQLYINNDNANGTVVNNTLNVTTAGAVGIGTPTPNAKLSVENVGGSDTVALLNLSENEDAEFFFEGGFLGTGASGNSLKLKTFWGNNPMTWRGDGNVGVGTVSPGHRLHVVHNGGTGLSGIALHVENADPNAVAMHVETTTSSDATVVITQGGTGDIMRGFNGGGSPVFQVLNSGEVVTPVLQITGGSDLVEGFESTGCPCEPGSVMALDAEAEGHLAPAATPYDRRVAGVVSGAGGVKPGIRMGQEGTLDGDISVAIAGRVYVRATSSNGAIRPGDLLTSSDRPGIAMKATDPARSMGAVIGKAISSLEDGDGLVLTLVNLQ